MNAGDKTTCPSFVAECDEIPDVKLVFDAAHSSIHFLQRQESAWVCISCKATYCEHVQFASEHANLGAKYTDYTIVRDKDFIVLLNNDDRSQSEAVLCLLTSATNSRLPDRQWICLVCPGTKANNCRHMKAAFR